MSDLSYVRDEMIPEQEPPASTVGLVGWMRANLFSGWSNTVLTLLSLAAIVYVAWALVPWILSPTWQAASLNECRGLLHEVGREGHFSGACWGVIRDRWVQLLFGFYPADLYWRPILALVLLAVALAPVLFAGKVSSKLLIFTAAYPVIFPWLHWGGAIWYPVLVLAGFVLAYLIYAALTRAMSSLIGVSVGIVFLVVWLVWGVSFVGGLIDKGVGSARLNSQMASADEAVATHSAKVADLEARLKDARKEVGAVMAGDKAARKEGNGAYRALIAEAMPKRNVVADLSRDLAIANALLDEANRTKRQVEQLPENEARLPEVSKQAKEARAALPDTVSDVANNNARKALQKRIVDEKLDIPRADLEALDRTLSLEAEVTFLEGNIATTYADVARLGLRPVESRKFGGFMLSILIGVIAIAVSLPLGIMLALGRQSDLPLLKWMCVGFIEFIRGVPLITLLFVASTLLNIFLPPGTNFDIIVRVMIMATLFASAYMAEVVRGGLAALPKGQYEGADSLGLNYWQAQRLIIMPQALKISIPGIVSTFIGLFKDTVLVSIISLLDPLGLSNAIRADAAWNGIVWEIYGFIALLFFIVCFGMSRYSMYLERRLQTGHR